MSELFGNIPEFTQKLLYRRGIESNQDAMQFLYPSYENHMHDPFLMHDMEKGVVRIFEAMEAKEKIIIYGDYDCDGIPGSVILHDLFQKIGYTNASVYIPHRHDEGYGLNKEAIELFRDQDVKLIITVDLGTTDIEEIAHAESFGIDVIVTDHHIPHGELPRAYAIINPKLPSTGSGQVAHYPDPMLCGAGVAFKLASAFLKKYGEYYNVPAGWEKWLLDMAALGTLSDMVPLLGENRTISHFGLRVLKKTPRPGLLKLLKIMKIDPRHLTEDDLTFMVTPRINAASRMDTPMRAFELLSTKDEAAAGALALHLSKINDERKTLVATIMREANNTLEAREEKEIILIGNPKWRVGVLGLVASKLMEEYKKPAFVWGMGDSTCIKGSCRSDG